MVDSSTRTTEVTIAEISKESGSILREYVKRISLFELKEEMKHLDHGYFVYVDLTFNTVLRKVIEV